MAVLWLCRISFLLGALAVQVLSQKILSSKKKCGDPQCESLMMRASAMRDYAGADCRFLSFKAGEEINVYYKLAEGRDDLWQGSTGKAYGFFPRDVVNIEEVFLSEEVEVPAQEIDFVCLDGGEYVFENEDSVLHRFRENEEDFMTQLRRESGEKKSLEGEESQDGPGIKEPMEDVTDVTDQTLEETTDKPPLAPSGIAGWFGMGRINDMQDNPTKAEHTDEEGLVVEPTSENNVAQPTEPEPSQIENSGWFGTRLKTLLPFGGKNAKGEAEASSATSQFPNEELVVETERENTSLNPQEVEQENREPKDAEEPKSKWFNFAIKDVLSFRAKNEKMKEEPSQNADEARSNEMTDQLSTTPSNFTERYTETVVGQPTMEETMHDKELDPNRNLEPATYGSKVGNVDVMNHQEIMRTPEKENNIKFQENPEDGKPGNSNHEDTNHESTHWLKSVVSNVMNFGKGGRDRVKNVQEPIKETNHDLSDRNLVTLNDNAKSSSGETRPSRDGFMAKSIDEHTQDMPSDESGRSLKEGILTALHNDPAISKEESSTHTNKRHLEDDVALNLHQEMGSPTKVDPGLDSGLKISLKTEEVTGQCGSGEQSANGYCTVQQREGPPMRNAQSTEGHCDDIVQTSSAFLVLPSAAEMTIFMEKIWLQTHEIFNDIIVPVRFALTSSAMKVVSLLPEDLQPGPDFHGCSWEVVIVTALLGCLSVLAFTCRTLRCIRSRCYAGREGKLGEQVAEIINSKSEVLEKLSLVQQQYDEVQQTIQGSGHQKLLQEITEQKALQETLQTSNKELEENITRLEKDVEEEKQRGSELDNTLSELNEKIKALEDIFRNEKSLKDEIRTTQKVFEINKERLESSVRDAAEEQAHLQESIKQLSKEAEGWEERFSELSENSRMLNSSVQAMQEDLSNRQGQVKSLVDSLLKLKDWSSEVEEMNKDEDEDGVLAGIKWDFENGEPLGDPQKQTIKKLIYAAMLNATLKSDESEKKQMYENLSDEMKAKEHFSECITNLQNTNQSLSLEKGQLEEEVEKLKQKMSVMMEVYQENERKLHRKLTVQEKDRLQKEAKLNKADEKVSLAATELVTVKTRLTELEEETERTVCSYQAQATSYEKKSHDNWLTARAAERYLSDVKRETLHLRQKLTEAEYKLELLEKDPFALDVIQAIGRAYADAFINLPESSPYGLSPINRVAESRAFLSPPPLLEGPLRLSPMLPAGDRGMRPPGYYPGYPGPKERSDINSDRKSDHQRTLSDAGSLSPPWDREQKNNVPPPGLPFPDHHFPPRRPDRFYHYPPPSGRFSGPAELTRNQGKPLVESLDGRSSPEYKLRGNTSRDGQEEANNVPGAPPMEGDVMDGAEYPMHPPPPMRIPLLPMDPRAPFFRRPFPLPPPAIEMYGAPGYPALPPHIAMRGPLPPPPQRYPSYPMPGEAFYPPQHTQPPPRGETPPSDSAPHSLPETQT
ncbi:melanoma inhibitory activity protein 2 [Mantella aurantiaca]